MKKTARAFYREFLTPALFFLFAVALFLFGLSRAGAMTGEKSLADLKNAVRRAAVSCYAIEGVYPPDLLYLRENYGLMIDEEKYFVRYDAFASNLMPEIEVYVKRSAGQK